MMLLFHKPCGVLTRFTPDGSPNKTLAEFGFPANVYALGRLDADSEGLLLLTDEAGWNEALLSPQNGHVRTYWAQVEGLATPQACERIAGGMVLRDGPTRPCQARVLEGEPALPPREPPIRFRKSVPTSWLELELAEGRNRQVRRMTAAAGLPTLRLVRVAMGGVRLGTLAQGRWRQLSEQETRCLREAVQPKNTGLLEGAVTPPKKRRRRTEPRHGR